jgi:hypothetical protein
MFKCFFKEFSRMVKIDKYVSKAVTEVKEKYIKFIQDADYDKHTELFNMVESRFTVDFFKLIGRLEQMPIGDVVEFKRE